MPSSQTDPLAVHRARASSVTQEHAYTRGPRITAIETVIPRDAMSSLLLVRVHTDAGTVDGEPVIGQGETYYLAEACAAVIHDWMAPRLLGSDACAIESHWRFLYERTTAFGGTGAELRALSAIDLALWDILGQLTRQPVWRLLGGPVRERIPVYNSCGGPLYGGQPGVESPAPASITSPRGCWPGHGDPGCRGPLEDNWMSANQPGDLAEELLAAGYKAMKLWSFDGIYQRCGGHRISWEDVRAGVSPFHAIRNRVGDRIEVILDGHGFFSLAAALRIAHAMREIRPLWLEDVVRPDNAETIAQFRKQAGVPIAVSEMLVTRDAYRAVLERQGADYVMIDPTWVGGISETRRIAELAQLYNVPVLMHDCTGPLTLMAGLQVAAAVPAVCYQETVRAHIATVYPRLIDSEVVVREGHIDLPERPGIGVRLLPALFAAGSRDYRVSRLV
jgi:L-alanine-DL-glutamate epimerase-like enolase superfamily enzyme